MTSRLSTPAASAAVDVYTTPDEHTVNGRQWRTWCGKYSQTVRCRTEKEPIEDTIKVVGN